MRQGRLNAYALLEVFLFEGCRVKLEKRRQRAYARSSVSRGFKAQGQSSKRF
jgi:hypothetical protein